VDLVCEKGNLLRGRFLGAVRLLTISGRRLVELRAVPIWNVAAALLNITCGGLCECRLEKINLFIRDGLGVFLIAGVSIRNAAVGDS